MIHNGLLSLALAFAGGPAPKAGEDQAYLAILAETKLMQMVGMPKMPELPPGVKLPPGVVMPGQPQRTLSVRLWSPSIAPADATATLAPPAGLKLGDALKLDLYRPTPADETGGKTPGFDPDANPEFTIKIYWGSSDKVQEGQPKIIRWAGLTPEQKAEMKRRARESQPNAPGSYFYKPNWTTGYWPTGKQPGNIAKDASLVGTYNLTTSYTGNVALDVPTGVDFLAPIEMSSPNLENKLNLANALGFEWKALPHALGQYASVIGMEGKNTFIIWSSSENYSEGLMGDMGFLQMAEVRNHVGNRTFMAPETTKMTVPAGIFKDADFAMLQMAAYGPGAARDETQPLPRVQSKSTLNIMLGGKMMKL
ncbi:MAG: hypothetical protein ACO1SV_18605 [Fimbriimonas sp.]